VVVVIDLKATDLHGTQEEFADILKKLGYKSHSNGSWNYSDANSKRGVWAYVHDNEITFTTYMSRNDADMQKQINSANIMAVMFNGRVFDPQTGKYIQPKLKKSERIKIMEWRLLK
jgi:hypothetical protein